MRYVILQLRRAEGWPFPPEGRLRRRYPTRRHQRLCARTGHAATGGISGTYYDSDTDGPSEYPTLVECSRCGALWPKHPTPPEA